MERLELRYLSFPDSDMEFREADNGLGRVEGVLLRYGDTARIMSWGEDHEERFQPGALAPYAGPIVANVLHDRSRLLASRPGNMSLDFGEVEVRAAFDLPDTTDGREAAELIRMGVLSSLSAEFRVNDDAWAGKVRTIRSATLYGLGLVAQPAYPASQLNRSTEAVYSFEHKAIQAGLQASYRRNLLRGLL